MTRVTPDTWSTLVNFTVIVQSAPSPFGPMMLLNIPVPRSCVATCPLTWAATAGSEASTFRAATFPATIFPLEGAVVVSCPSVLQPAKIASINNAKLKPLDLPMNDSPGYLTVRAIRRSGTESCRERHHASVPLHVRLVSVRRFRKPWPLSIDGGIWATLVLLASDGVPFRARTCLTLTCG